MKDLENLYKHKHIVLGGDNMNTLSIIRSLGESGISPVAIIVQEGNTPLVHYCRFVGEYITTYSIEECVPSILRFSNESLKPFVYTSDDNHQRELDLHYEILKDKFYFFNAGGAGSITHLMNKDVLCNLAKRNGFVIPEGEVVNRGDLPQKLAFPVFTKTITPYSQGWKTDAGIYYSPEELLRGYKNMLTDQFLLQEYIAKKNEFEIHGFSINGGQHVFLSFYSLYYRVNETSFGYYKYYSLLKDKELEERIIAMIREIRYTGVFEVEFLVDQSDRLIFLEINFRFALSNYACTFGGVNLPVLWAQSVLNGCIETDRIIPTQKQFSFMNEFPDLMSIRRTKQVSLWEWFSECVNADCLMLFHRNDQKPFWGFLSGTVIHFLRKRFNKVKALSRKK